MKTTATSILAGTEADTRSEENTGTETDTETNVSNQSLTSCEPQSYLWTIETNVTKESDADKVTSNDINKELT